MIDWFVSKIGLLIFVTAAAAVLLAFFLIFSGNFRLQSDAAAATDIARLIDSVGEGSSVAYAVPLKSYTLNITGRILNVNAIERAFVSNANSTLISNAAKLLIEKSGGIVYVRPA